MYPHRIRLRGPWIGEPLFRFTGDVQQSVENLPPAFRMRMPGRWSDGGLSDFRGSVRFTRTFGYPGQIDDTERVWLTFAGITGHATVVLNDQPLGAIGGETSPSEFEVTSLLRPRNVLRVDVESPESTGGLWGEVALEVRATAFLRDTRFACVAGKLTARCWLVGEATRPLDLYLLASDRFLTHMLVEPAPAGKLIAIAGQLADLAKQKTVIARLELVDAATIWYVVRGIVEWGKSNPAADSSLE